MPKNEIGATTTDLFNSEFIAISLGYEQENEIIKVIPMDINSEIVTGQFWINSNNLISEMILITKDKGSYSAKLSYAGEKFDLPSNIKITFDVKNPITIWIQYSEGDSQRYYKQRNQRKYGKNTSETFTV